MTRLAGLYLSPRLVPALLLNITPYLLYQLFSYARMACNMYAPRTYFLFSCLFLPDKRKFMHVIYISDYMKFFTRRRCPQCIMDRRAFFAVSHQRRLDSRPQSIMGIERLIPRRGFIDC